MSIVHRLSIAAAALACLAPSVAMAATWGYGTTASACYTGSLSSATTVQNAGTCEITATGDGAATAGNAELRAYANYGGTTSQRHWRVASLTNQGSGSGYGVNNRQSADTGEGVSPEHAVDNDYFTDAIAYGFDKSTILESVRIGWSGTDGDISVLYYDGTGDAFASMGNWGTASGFAASGWKLLSHYNVAGGISSPDVDVDLKNTGNISSSFWLVTAYNSAFGSTGSWSSGKDYFKLLSVSGRTPQSDVAEPGALALAGLALGGMVVLRRRRNSR